MARIDTDDGMKTIHLGPKKQLSELNLAVGDHVSVLTRQGNVSGKSALIALQIRANDKTVKIVRNARRGDRRQAADRDRSES